MARVCVCVVSCRVVWRKVEGTFGNVFIGMDDLLLRSDADEQLLMQFTFNETVRHHMTRVSWNRTRNRTHATTPTSSSSRKVQSSPPSERDRASRGLTCIALRLLHDVVHLSYETARNGRLRYGWLVWLGVQDAVGLRRPRLLPCVARTTRDTNIHGMTPLRAARGGGSS